MSHVVRWLAPGVWVANGVLLTAVSTRRSGQNAGVLGGLPPLLTITLTLVAVFSAHRTRRGRRRRSSIGCSAC
jgi:hypothetical protein